MLIVFMFSSYVHDSAYCLQAAEFFFFAAFMTVATILYAVMGYFYKSVKPAYIGNEGYNDQHQLKTREEPVASETKQSPQAAN